MRPTVQEVTSLRAQLWDAGFRPVEICNHDDPGPSPGKRPVRSAWQIAAQADPPRAAIECATPDALNTGIWCGGLRAIDIDVDNPTLAQACRNAVFDILGEAPMRTRRGSSRCLLLYRAAEGEPKKRVKAGTLGKVEALGHGQQFVAFGTHDSGVDLEWFPEPPGQERLEALPVVTEDQVDELLERVAPIIDAKTQPKANGLNGKHHNPDLQADFFRIAQAVAQLPNTGAPDWEAWNSRLMSIWSATGGSDAGREIARLWSARHPSHDPAHFEERWAHYSTSPPTFIGAASIFAAAREAFERQQFESPDPLPDADSTDQPTTDQDPLTPRLFPLEYFADIQPVTHAQDFVEGLLIEQTMSVVYGESNSGKTFFTTNLAFHVACGWPWEGREVERGAVVYCALEGGHGIRNRISALARHHGLEGQDIPFAIVPVTINMLDPAQDIDTLIRTIRHVKAKFNLPVRLTVMDTLSRAMVGGNENAPDDMGALVTNGAAIQQETGSHLCWVHHSGKDQAKGARGHSLLRAATDTEIEITSTETGRMGKVTKQRDMECVGDFPFKLKVIELGDNHRGKPITSCVVIGPEAGDAPVQPRARTKSLTANAQIALRALGIAMSKSGAQLPPTSDYPSDTAAVSATEWRAEFDELKAGSSPDTRKHAFSNGQSALLAAELITSRNGLVWFVKRDKTG